MRLAPGGARRTSLDKSNARFLAANSQRCNLRVSKFDFEIRARNFEFAFLLSSPSRPSGPPSVLAALRFPQVQSGGTKATFGCEGSPICDGSPM